MEFSSGRDSCDESQADFVCYIHAAQVMASSPKPQPESDGLDVIPALTDTYQKAHKSYVLASGLLLSWVLIGISLETKEKWGITLKSPNAVPLILLALVFYSGYRLIIEWAQCDPRRKNIRAAKLDNLVAHFIALSALVIAFIQYLLRIQIVDVARTHQMSILLGVVTIYVSFGVPPAIMTAFYNRYAHPPQSIFLRVVIPIVLMLIAQAGWAVFAARQHRLGVVISACVGFMIIVAMYVSFHVDGKRFLRKPDAESHS
jgi:hypothetical protein